MPDGRLKDVVILLPGITGSVLRKNGTIVWGYSASTIGRALITQGTSMQRELALPDDDPDVDDLGDGVVADALIPDFHILPGVWKIDGYSKIAKAIAASFDVTEGENFFEFPYDWRRTNVVAARKLAKATKTYLAAWRKTSGNDHAKLILIGHSMGGLVARYFIECLEGWKDTRALVTFGTPFRGSLNALDGLANGTKMGPLDLSGILRQFTSVYELLPIYECYDAGNGKLTRVGETTGIPNIDYGKAATALTSFHREIESAAKTNRTLPQYEKEGYRSFPVVGIAQQTNLSAQLNGSKVEMLQTYNGEALGGDGTVPRVSAIPIELSANPSAVYASTKHGSLQNDDAVITNLIGILSGLDLDLGAFRKGPTEPKNVGPLRQPARVQVTIEVEDISYAGEPVVVRARPNGDSSLKLAMWRSGEDQPAAILEMTPATGNWQHAEFTPPCSGAYRAVVTGENAETAQDSFAVVDAKGEKS
jgi:hypothetical protein